MTNQDMAELLYPQVKLTSEEVLKKYPHRNVSSGQVVSRYAPSPTGYMHLGNFFQMFISYNLTRVTDGLLFLRIEDTDAKRFKADATQVIYDTLKRYDIKFDEYQTLNGKDIGEYGPYFQSQRKEIYQAFAKKLVAEGKAFPCFCPANEGKADILKRRENKFVENDEFEYDVCRNLTYQQVETKLNAGEKFALRLKTKNTGKERITFHDLIKGDIETKANAKDFVIIKNDGIPPYPFAHVVDDTLMGTTIVVRGEEYISSTPMHIELFAALGFKPVTYCHNPLICKFGEDGNRRKVSKRYDPEADMRFYAEEGYPNDAVFEYLLNLINSGFEIWRNQNPSLSWRDFKFTVNDITTVAPIFDMLKLNDIAKSIFSRKSASEVLNGWFAWAQEFDVALANYLKENEDYAKAFLNIDRENPKPRKDIYNYKMIRDNFLYMFQCPQRDELITEDEENYQAFMSEYNNSFVFPSSNEQWFAGVKEVAERLGYAIDNKAYKLNPEAFKGNVAKACEFVRIAITGRKNSPSLFEIMSVLGEQETLLRLKNF